MLEIIYGRAGSGKTSAALNKIKERVCARVSGNYFIVPEQFSFDAEKEMCALCGDSLSLYGECLSFTGLSRLVDERLRLPTPEYLDEAGKLLCMVSALRKVGGTLQFFSNALRNADTQSSVVDLIDELKSAGIGKKELDELIDRCRDEGKYNLLKKLSDIRVIWEQYDSIIAAGKADPSDRLTRLCQLIESNSLFGKDDLFCIDGFVDFTGQQQKVLFSLLDSGVNMVVCFTADGAGSKALSYSTAGRAMGKLVSYAERNGIDVIYNKCEKKDSGALDYFCDNVFSWGSPEYDGEVPPFCRSYCASYIGDECENIAARILEIVKETGCSFRDIAVGIRGINDYAPTLMPILEYYGVPAMLSASVPLLTKSLPALIYGLFEIIEGGWEQDAVISYMRTGLTGLSEDECDLMESYIYRCRLKSWDWESDTDFCRSPEGFFADGSGRDKKAEEKAEKLAKYLYDINEIRKKLSAPILQYKRAVGMFNPASAGEELSLRQHSRILNEYFNSIDLPRLLTEKSRAFAAAGRDSDAAEMQKIWKTVVKALEQCAALPETVTLKGGEFGKLFRTVLSKYDINIIPVALDKVCVGDFDRMRKRNISYLIIAGASESRLPAPVSDGGIFSEADYSFMSRGGGVYPDYSFGSSPEDKMLREYSLIYNTLSLPNKGLIMSYTTVNGEGSGDLPSMVFSEFCRILKLNTIPVNIGEASSFAPKPFLSNAVSGGWREDYCDVAKHFAHNPKLIENSVKAAAEFSRGSLSPAAVKSLYGENMSLSASRLEQFRSCKFKYFCNYGLKAAEYKPVEFDALDMGTFIHYVLEKVFSAPLPHGITLKRADDDTVKGIVRNAVEEYKQSKIIAYESTPARFKFLFDRYCEDVYIIVSDFITELKHSDFAPLFTEKHIDGEGLALADGVRLSGSVDRIDVFEKDGKTYFRVIDYKTGTKELNLYDIFYGKNIQMLLYMFALELGGEKYFGKDAVPAGVVYLPASNKTVSSGSDMDDDTLDSERLKKQKRHGIVLDNPDVINAWDHTEKKDYFPERTVNRRSRNLPVEGDNVLSAEKFGRLYQHIEKLINESTETLRQGDIEAAPEYTDDTHTACTYCDYNEICLFKDGCFGESFSVLEKLKAAEVWEKI